MMDAGNICEEHRAPARSAPMQRMIPVLLEWSLMERTQQPVATYHTGATANQIYEPSKVR